MKRHKKEKKELSKDKKMDGKTSTVQEEPPSPVKDEENKISKVEIKQRGSHALADMDKTTFDAVRVTTLPHPSSFCLLP